MFLLCTSVCVCVCMCVYVLWSAVLATCIMHDRFLLFLRTDRQTVGLYDTILLQQLVEDDVAVVTSFRHVDLS